MDNPELHGIKLEAQAERVMADRMLPGLLRTAKGRMAVVEACQQWILSRAGELDQKFMPTVEQLPKIESRVADEIEKRMKDGWQPNMAELNVVCDEVVKALMGGTL